MNNISPSLLSKIDFRLDINVNPLKGEIRSIISRSKVPEDPPHAQNTLGWLLKLKPDADKALQIAALGHDIGRAMGDQKVGKNHYENFDALKAAHAENSASVLKKIMENMHWEKDLREEVFRLLRHHEIGGDPRSDLIRDADGLSFFGPICRSILCGKERKRL